MGQSGWRFWRRGFLATNERFLLQFRPCLPPFVPTLNTALHRQVLVLNRLWQPINTVSARRAVSLVFLGHAHVVGTDDDNQFHTHDIHSWMTYSRDRCKDHAEGMIRSVSRCLRVPEIIVLALFDRLPKKQVKFTRENIYRRDSYTCQYCTQLLRPQATQLGSCHPPRQGWSVYLGKCGLLMHSLQYPQGQQAPGTSQHVSQAPAQGPQLATALQQYAASVGL